jgi:hypothetical protein
MLDVSDHLLDCPGKQRNKDLEQVQLGYTSDVVSEYPALLSCHSDFRTDVDTCYIQMPSALEGNKSLLNVCTMCSMFPTVDTGGTVTCQSCFDQQKSFSS